MSFEQKINYQLNKVPGLKKVIKRCYQLGMYAISPKVKSQGNIVRVSPDDGREYFFGYYDKSPWDATGRYMICMAASDTWSDVSPRETADILLLDTQNGNAPRKIAETRSWNVQQGCMAQWLGPDFSSRIIYNDYRGGRYVSVALNVESGEERVIDAPVYTVSADGRLALTLDFSRLYSLRPGYGYYNVPESTKGVALPDETAIWTVDIESAEVRPLLKYTDFASFSPRPEMLEEGAVHKVNHLMLSPDGKRFMVLYRWFVGQRKYTRLITCNTDGSDMYLLSDDDMVSHCFWKNDREILAFENKKDGGPGYYLMKDRSPEYQHLWTRYSNDGHPSYSPDGTLIVTDSYPDRARMADIKLLREDASDGQVIARVFAPFKYDNDTRCDLHPRWSRDGKMICFDSVFEGCRGLYVVNLAEEAKARPQQSDRKRLVYVFTSCKRSGPVQIMYNLISNLDLAEYEPVLITLYDEVEGESDLDRFISLGVKHYRVPLGKKDIMLGRTDALKSLLQDLHPAIIHSMGVFPDYAVSGMGFDCQVITLHNYMHQDYLAKFGAARGIVLEKLQMHAVKKAAKVWTCSKSLADIYREKNNLEFDFIRNGVDVSRYRKPGDSYEKVAMRERFGLPQNRKIFVYAGQFIERKDQDFLLSVFSSYDALRDTVLLLLGAGPDFELMKERYEGVENVIFTGNVPNVEDYLLASDYYISSSHSEGLPTSVLEAMSCGLPVILSDIPQHLEILEIAPGAGCAYALGEQEECVRAVAAMLQKDREESSELAYRCVHEELSASVMSRRYQEEYEKVILANNGK